MQFVCALVVIVILLIWTIVAAVFLMSRYRMFKDVGFYRTWNTFVYEMNPLYMRPPLYNFLNLLKNLVLALWICAWAHSEAYLFKFGGLILLQLGVS